ncbi:MAG: biotin transporter BioY [Treponema sp.]|nr:biotin transporter BioY [Treponema sp.]
MNTIDNKTINKNEKSRASSKTLVKISLTSLFAALIAAGTFIAIPIGPVPIVLQNLFCLLSGLILGPLLGGAAVGLFLLAGILNFPVFAGASGGIARFAGPTGGFLIGYLLMAIIAGLIAGKPRSNKIISLPRLIAAVTAGMLIVYVPGVAWLKLSRGLSWPQSFSIGFVPFIIGDILKGITAVLISKRLRKITAEYLNG